MPAADRFSRKPGTYENVIGQTIRAAKPLSYREFLDFAPLRSAASWRAAPLQDVHLLAVTALDVILP